MNKKKLLFTFLFAGLIAIPAIGKYERDVKPAEAAISAFTFKYGPNDEYDFATFEDVVEEIDRLNENSTEKNIWATLNKDIVTTEYLNVTAPLHFSLDLNGHKMEQTHTQTNGGVFISFANNDADLTIEDSSEEKTGEIKASLSPVYVMMASTVRIMGGTLTSSGENVSGNEKDYAPLTILSVKEEDDCYISGGTFNAGPNGVAVYLYTSREYQTIGLLGNPVFNGFFGISSNRGYISNITLVGALDENFKRTPISIIYGRNEFTKENEYTAIRNWTEKMGNKNLDDYFYSLDPYKKLILDNDKVIFDNYGIAKQPTLSDPTFEINYPNDVKTYKWLKVEDSRYELNQSDLDSGKIDGEPTYENGVFVSSGKKGNGYLIIYYKGQPELFNYEIELTEYAEGQKFWNMLRNEETVELEVVDGKIIVPAWDYNGENAIQVASDGAFKAKVTQLCYKYEEINGENEKTFKSKDYIGKTRCLAELKDGGLFYSDILTYEKAKVEETVIENNNVAVELNIPEEGEYKEGFDPSKKIDLVVEVKVEAEVSNAKSIVDYNKLPDKVKLDKGEKVSQVYSVKLIQTIDGVSKEIQPSDIKEGTTIKVTMKLPNELDLDKVTKILHVHSADDIETINFDKSKVVDGKYSIVINKLSEFAFVTYDAELANQNSCWLHWLLVVLLVAMIAYTLILHFIYKKPFEFNLMNKIISIAFIVVSIAVGLIGVFVNRCPVCIVFLCINAFAAIAGTVQHSVERCRKQEKKKKKENAQ